MFNSLHSDLDEDGDVDSADVSILTGVFGGGTPDHPADLNGDGAIDGQDFSIINAREGDTLSTNDTLVTYPRDISARLDTYNATLAHGLCPIGHQGLYHDEELGNDALDNRVRYRKGQRFLQGDPLGYPDGMNAYVAYHLMRGGVDPLGLFGGPIEPPKINYKRKAASKDCRCGVDVTDCLKFTMDELVKAFLKRTPDERSRLCKSMDRTFWPLVTLQLSQVVNGWDIYELGFGPDGKFSSNKCNQAGHCEKTVTVSGNCFRRSHVNYYLYGYMRRMCGRSWYMTAQTIAAYRVAAGAPYRWLSHGTRARMDLAYAGWTDAEFHGIHEDNPDLGYLALDALSDPATDIEIKNCPACDEKYGGSFNVRIGQTGSTHLMGTIDCERLVVSTVGWKFTDPKNRN